MSNSILGSSGETNTNSSLAAIILVISCIVVAFFFILCYKKTKAAYTAGALATRTTKEKIASAVTLSGLLLLLFTPAFTLIEMTFFVEVSFNGFSFVFPGNDLAEQFGEFFVLMSLLANAIWVCGAILVAGFITEYFTQNDKGAFEKNGKAYLVGSGAVSLLYWIIGIFVNYYAKSEGYIETTTLSYVPFVIIVALFIASTVCKTMIADDFNLSSVPRTSGSARASNNSEKFEELKKYKELLDCGIITQEEFDAKKKELLGMTESADS